MVSRLVGAVAGGAVLFLLAMIVITGGEVASSAQPLAGGCVVTAEQPGTPGPGTAGVTQKSAELNANQMAAARTVVGVGKSMGIAERGIAIAVGTAMQESTLKPSATSGRSVGLFQQQGELYSGIDRTDPAAAARAFYQQLLARVPGYADPAAGTFADIAQQVQQSGAGPRFYAQWENWATTLARELITGPSGSTGAAPVVCKAVNGPTHTTVTRSGRDVTLPTEAGLAGTITFPNEQAAIAAAAALSYLGTPYAWGGGGPSGPSPGLRGDNAVADQHGDYNKTGFDCSGLTEYAWAQAGIAIGGDSRTQFAAGGNEHPYSEALPGDLLFWGGSYHSIHHVALYLGTINGQHYMVEAPNSGDVVKVSTVRTGGDFNSAINRPWER